MLEILSSIMKMSNDKRSTLMYFLDDDIVKMVQRYDLVESKDLYLKNKVILIHKSTLLNEYDGTIEYINGNTISIRKNNGNRITVSLMFEPRIHFILHTKACSLPMLLDNNNDNNI